MSKRPKSRTARRGNSPCGAASLTRKAGYKRRLAIELLEPRWLLSYTNSPISQSQKSIINGGLSGLANWAQLVGDHNLAGQLLPVVGQSVGTALGLQQILDQGLAQKIATYFTADSTPTTDELVAACRI